MYADFVVVENLRVPILIGIETLQDVSCQINCVNRQVYIDERIILFGWLEQDPNMTAGKVQIVEKTRVPKRTRICLL